MFPWLRNRGDGKKYLNSVGGEPFEFSNFVHDIRFSISFLCFVTSSLLTRLITAVSSANLMIELGKIGTEHKSLKIRVEAML